MTEDDESPKKKDLTSILDLPQAPEVPLGSEDDSSFDPLPLPTGDETGHGEAPTEFQTSADSSLFEGLPPLDAEIEALASSSEFDSPSSSSDFNTTIDHPPLTAEDVPFSFDPETTSPEKTRRTGSTSAPAQHEKTKTSTRTTTRTTSVRKSPGPRPSVDQIRDYSDTVTPEAGAPATASTPFSLLIEGPLQIHEKEKLIQILTQERVGIREVEIEPQLNAGRILIPRISEYAGVILVQALRNSQARLRLGPSEQIFSSDSESDSDADAPNSSTSSMEFLDERRGTILSMRVTSEQSFPDVEPLEVVDTLHGSLLIKASQVLSSRSTVVQESIEKLKTQMKLQAHYRGANGIVNFKTELHPNPEHSHYTLLAHGVAVRTHP